MLPAASPPLPSGGGGKPLHAPRGRQEGQPVQPTHSSSPPPPNQIASPSPGVVGRSRQARTELVHQLPYLSASPSAGLDGRLARELLTHHRTSPADSLCSYPAPTWSSIVRERKRARNSLLPPPATPLAALSREDFFALYERCIKGCLKARFTVHHAAGIQEVSLTCSITPLPFTTIAPTTKHTLAPTPSPESGCNSCLRLGCTATATNGRRFVLRTIINDFGANTSASNAVCASWAST
jgi:hypothetical protein